VLRRTRVNLTSSKMPIRARVIRSTFYQRIYIILFEELAILTIVNQIRSIFVIVTILAFFNNMSSPLGKRSLMSTIDINAMCQLESYWLSKQSFLLICFNGWHILIKIRTFLNKYLPYSQVIFLQTCRIFRKTAQLIGNCNIR